MAFKHFLFNHLKIIWLDFFGFDLLLEEIFKKKYFYFGWNDDTKMTFLKLTDL